MKIELPRPNDPAWLAANPGSSYICSVCGGRTTHIERCDAYACLSCNRWEEDSCSDPDCEFCTKRPLTPR